MLTLWMAETSQFIRATERPRPGYWVSQIRSRLGSSVIFVTSLSAMPELSVS